MSDKPESGLTHFDEKGEAVMVDVSEKTVSSRTAIARGRIVMAPETLALIREGGHKKGDVLGVARIGEDQLADYAARRGVDVETATRWLRPNLD